jgi:hypothetical protein
VIRCIAFGGSSLTGEQVLAQSGLEYQTVAFGGLSDAVCQVDGEPVTFPPTCWTGSSPFWELFIARKGGSWSWSSLGMSALVVHDGDSEGLRFEPQTSTSPPVEMGNCPSSTPTPRPTPKPTPLPTTRPTATLVPTIKPGSTAQPSLTPASPSAAGSAPPTGAASTTPGAAIAGVSGSAAPSQVPTQAGATTPPAGSGGNGSPALPIAILAIVGLAGLAATRRRPAGSRPPR